MTVYVVQNVRPDDQVFSDYDKAFEFAKAKAHKRGCPTDIWFKGKKVYRTSIYCGGASHVYICEREIG